MADRLRSPVSGDRPIRVLHVITRMVKGGAQENTLATVRAFNGGGWESVLAAGPALGPEGSMEEECEAAGVPVIRLPHLRREIAPAADLLALREILALIRMRRPDLLHTHTSKAGILGRAAVWLAGVPGVVHTPHGHVFHDYGGGLKTRLFVTAERRCAPMAHRLIALTESERREHLALGVGRPEQWEIVHSGVDFAPFEGARGSRDAVRRELGLAPEDRVIGTVGRLVPIKGQSTLLEAYARLVAADSDASSLRLLLVGDGPLREELTARARSLGLVVAGGGPAPAPTVHFLGLRRDVPRLMAAMDVFALPSLNEGMGRVLVEAMAMELPCVASRVSGTPDVVEDGGTGYLVPARDAEAFARALRRLLDEPALAREMGRAGRRKAVPGFSRDRMIEKLETVYRSVLEERGVLRARETPCLSVT